MQTRADSVTPERIYQFAWGYVPPLVMEAAIHHRVFDVLDSGPKTLDEIQKATGASKRGLSAIINVLVGLNFLAKEGRDTFSLTPESSTFLVSSKPTFQGGILRHGSEDLIPKWLRLNEIVGTGKPTQAVNQESAGAEFFSKFVNDIFPMSYPAAQVLARHLQLDKAGEAIRVLDLAAGSGVWGIALAQSSARVRVTAVDWPEIIPITRRMAARFGLEDRFSFVEGDLNDVDFGTGHNIATLGQILHSEGAERSRALLQKTCHALSSGGTIAIAEFLVNPDRTGPLNGLIFAVNMLVNTENGDTYSFEEIASWLSEAGFINARTVESPGPSPLILANKP
jgi:3-hydroxy-5-methyl-1-naphthoate 3-O-methyltransferase